MYEQVQTYIETPENEDSKIISEQNDYFPTLLAYTNSNLNIHLRVGESKEPSEEGESEHPCMAVDLLRVHRILSTLLETKWITATSYIEGRGNTQKTTELLLECKQDSKDSIRRTIMEHDKVFRQQVHELHRLYHVQKTLMVECDSHRYQSRAEGTHKVVQGSRSNLKCSPSTSGTNQSALLGNAQYPAPQQVHEDFSLHECKPVNCLNLF
ncbi:hypothetical protein ACJX0J_013788, partial [Zea mays]